MLDKAGKLLAQVGMDEAKRELLSAQKQLGVAHRALEVLLNVEGEIAIEPISPLFMNEELPDEYYFKSLLTTENYTVAKLKLEESMAHNQVKISQSAYVPTIAVFANQTLWCNNMPKNLVPRTLLCVGFTLNLFDVL